MFLNFRCYHTIQYFQKEQFYQLIMKGLCYTKDNKDILNYAFDFKILNSLNEVPTSYIIMLRPSIQ